MNFISKILKILEYTVMKSIMIFLICLYLFIGSMAMVVVSSLIYGIVMETIKHFNPLPKAEE